MNNRFTLLRLPNALCRRFTVASGISKQLEYIGLCVVGFQCSASEILKRRIKYNF
ncbi:MAG: hypothetical protein LBJ00_00155 [Planctomycetaceae bacterium]|nr:hypothetical protein [Planctomycetaceae bacterium]